MKKIILRILVLISFISAIIILIIQISKTKQVTATSVENNVEPKNEVLSVTLEPEKPEIDSKVTDWDLILVNKDNKIPEDYQFELQTIEKGNQVDSRIVQAITQMLADARSAGLNPYICSSYRTPETQVDLYNKKVKQYKALGYPQQQAEIEASYWVTYPRTSEHEIGLALDIVSNNYRTLNEEQEKTEVQKWLMENCNKYGFILRYPTDKKDITKINYEPWHYRYVGIENATFMKEKQFCLEEYIEYLK